MKDTRKLSVIYFVISMMMLLLVCFGCEANTIDPKTIKVDYIHYVNGYEVYYSHDIQTKDELKEVADFMIEHNYDNFVIQSDSGIIEVEDGVITYQSK